MSNEPRETRQLVDDATRGDGEAVEALVGRHLPALHAFVRLNMSGGLRAREETVDVVQSACREVLADLRDHEWVSESTFRCWLFVSAQSKLKDRARFWRRSKRDAARDVAVVKGAERPWDAFIMAHAQSPSGEAMAREDADRLEEVIAELSEDERRIVLLARIVGMTSAAIGEELGRSDAAVRKTLARATARIALRLGRSTS